MTVGIILYSGTGHTRSVAEELAGKLSSRGHTPEIREITITGDATKGPDQFQLADRPSLDGVDALVFASPVQAFSLSPVMKRYLAELDAVPSVPVSLLVTEHLPFAWMGGNRAVREMTRALRAMGAAPGESMIVNWSNKRRSEQIAKGTERLAAAV
jgi:menaquinone-dependent protoporphyrinogen IX oxidase